MELKWTVHATGGFRAEREYFRTASRTTFVLKRNRIARVRCGGINGTNVYGASVTR